MEEKEVSLQPLRFIRIAKDMSQKDFAQYFLITPAYITALENGKRKISERTLRFGIAQLNIEYDDYLELEELSENLKQQKYDDLKKYRIMLIKAIGVIAPDLKEQTEELLQNYCKEKKKIIKLSQLSNKNFRIKKKILVLEEIKK